MNQPEIPEHVLSAFGLDKGLRQVKPIGSGHIHLTYHVDSFQSFVLQRVNIKVFTRPDIIANNIRMAADYLRIHSPDYLFLTPLRARTGDEMVYDEQGYPWRLFPFIENTFTIDFVSTPEEAHSAAREFGRLTRNLNELDPGQLLPTLDHFHNLGHRWNQFQSALASAGEERKRQAHDAINRCNDFQWLVSEYRRQIESGDLVLRITHNDTKINNILFSSDTGKAVCAIDLDTLMPGYFIYDLGDMIRTFVSPVNEEERDVSKIIFRTEIYDALVAGYLESMGAVLGPKERAAIPFGGMMMTYIMAMRMLTDYLMGDIYYHTTYPGQNLVRASNQFALLSVLERSLK